MSDNKSLVEKMAERFGVDPQKFFDTLKATAFKQRDGSAPTNEQMMVLMVVADQYGLNPFTKEIYAFPDKSNGIIPVVGVDGWSRIINSHKMFDGIDFVYSEQMSRPEGAQTECHDWIECVLYRSDRKQPIRIREYLDEVYRKPFVKNGKQYDGPWQSHPKRFLRHKSLIQAARIGFGFTGIYDQDEAERIRDMSNIKDVTPERTPARAAVLAQPPIALDHKKLDQQVEQLVMRASPNGAWQTAHAYVGDRLAGDELEYVKRKLSEAEEKSRSASLSVPEETLAHDDIALQPEAEVPARETAQQEVSAGQPAFF